MNRASATRRTSPASLPTRQTGIGLVELMVAIVIALFLVLAVASIYLNVRATSAAQDNLAQLQDSERLALTLITTTLQSAGYFVDPTKDTAATALPATTVSREDGGSTAFEAGQPVVGTGDGKGRGSNGDTIAMQYQTARNDGLMNCLGGTNTTQETAVFSNYFAVNANSELTCTVGNGSPQVLSGNIDRMSVAYGTDTDGDGALDTYLPASAVQAAGLWGGVHTVRVSVWFLDTTKSLPGKPVPLAFPVVQTIDLMNRS